MRLPHQLRRALQLESLENRRMFVVEIVVQPPVVSAFTTFAEVRGLNVEVSSQPVVTHTIDNAGIQQASKEIDGKLYSFQGNTVTLTDSITGATETRLLTPLPGSTGVQVRDVALLNGEIVYVGGSLTGNAAPTKNSIPTQWNAAGAPTAIGPSSKTGIANFITSEGIVGGFYEAASNQYTPWIRTPLGDFDLPPGSLATNPQMVTGASRLGFYLIGFEDNTPLVWEATALPETGEFQLILSTDLGLEYPTGATLGAAGRNFEIFENDMGSINIFGQFEIPIVVQGNITGYESHAAMWSLSGELLHDFGPNTEMLGAQVVGSTFIVAHRNSISFVDTINQLDVVTRPLIDLLGSQPPAGVTRKILNDGLLLRVSNSQTDLGINYSETSLSATRNKLSFVPLKIPDQLQLDVDNNGIWDETFMGSDMFTPFFEPNGYGQKTLPVRITYSDGSTTGAVTTYQSLPMESVNTGFGNDLLVGGTKAADTATILKLGDGNYRANIGGQTQEFPSIDNVLVRMSQGDDALVLAGGMLIDLTNLAEVEQIDTSATTVESILNIDATTVENQVGPTGTLLIKASPEDSIELLSGWTAAPPQTINGKATAVLNNDGKTVLLQTGNYTNPIDNLDTTGDGFVTARDALLVINHINVASGGATPPIDAYLDVSNNGVISALDVLLIINDINNRPSGEGEFVEPALITETAISMHEIIAHSSSSTDLDEISGARRRSRR